MNGEQLSALRSVDDETRWAVADVYRAKKQHTFQATVDPKILDKVTRFFNATLEDVFIELLQNARRSGASRIDVRQVNDDHGKAIVARDDGRGIDDPRTLLALGGSGWDAVTLQKEDPAGFGVLALSTRGAVIRSRRRGRKTGWSIRLTPDHFAGKVPVTSEPCEMDEGTEIIFPHRASATEVHSTLQQTACYCPVPTTFNGEPLDQQDFLKDAIHTESWSGINIGVYKRHYWTNNLSINVHGLTLKTALPKVSMVMTRDAFSVRLDIVDCPDLKLVLPTRKEVVQDAFFDELKTAVKRALYRAIAAEGSHDLPFAAWQEARALNITLPEALPELRPYVPDVTNDVDHFPPDPAAVPASAYLVTFEDEVQEHQCFWHAVEQSRPDLRIFEPSRAYEGYAWYDALSLIAGIRCHTTEGDRTAEVSLIEQCGDRERPDSITIEAIIQAPDGSLRTLSLDTDLLLTGDPWSIALDEVGLIVTRTSTMTPDQLVDLLETTYFSYSDDVGDDSYQTQQERFRDDARQIAIAFLRSQKEADIARLKDVIARHLVWLLPPDCKTTITAMDGNIDIQQEPVADDSRQIDAFPVEFEHP